MIAPRDLFAKPDSQRTAGGIIRWWEARRLHYNVIVFGWALLLALIASFWRGWHHEIWGFDSLALYLLFFQFPANVWYTGGLIVDLILKKALRLPSQGFGPGALRFGIAFSLLFYCAIFVFLMNG